jgi:hypothetical protein
MRRAQFAVRIPDGPLATAAALTGAAALLVAAAAHVAQLIAIFHSVPWIGPLFAADALASTVVAVALLTTRWRLAAACGALISAAALAGLYISSTVGLFGWQEAILRPSVIIAIASELVAVAALAPLALPAPRPAATAIMARGPAGGGLLAIAALHVAAAGEEWADNRTIFWLFMALAAACAALALRLAQGVDRRAWAFVSLLAASALAGYLLSRTTGVPGDADDVGDWGNRLGLAALAVEAVLLPLALTRLRTSPGPERAAVSPFVVSAPGAASRYAVTKRAPRRGW